MVQSEWGFWAGMCDEGVGKVGLGGGGWLGCRRVSKGAGEKNTGRKGVGW